MTAKILSFVADKKVHLQRIGQIQPGVNLKSVANSSPLRMSLPDDMEDTVQKDYKLFLSKMRTRSSEFMFPTILAGYRRGINPVDALYNYLQKTLFNYDKTDTTHVWVTDLFRDHEWTDRICHALEKDCNDIVEYQMRNNVPTTQVIELERIRLKFMHYEEVFKLMKVWKPY